ncbi:MAG: microcystin degradation protein MlrC [Gammaproteobacteria bacterium]|jgi:microcystin degradation protein MlrC
MKCVIALMQHETNTFSPLPTTLNSFASSVGLVEPPTGQQAIDIFGSAGFAFAGMLEVAREKGCEIVVPIAAYAEPSAKVEDHAFDAIADKICDAVAEGCDLLLLDLHGAMVTESHDDGEGELLRRIRQIAAELPIAVALDFHTNLTDMMVENCTVIDGYRTYPHIDMKETGVRAAQSLFLIKEKKIKAGMRWSSVPMMTHMIVHTPLKQPMKDIMDKAIVAADSDDFLNVSVFGGFPLADIAHVSLSVLSVSNLAKEQNERLINELCDMAWDRREAFVYDPEPLSQTIKHLKTLMDYPVVVADHGDNSGAGGSADDMTVLDEMLQSGLDGILAGPIWDPVAVDRLIAEGIDSTVSLSVGGRTDAPSIGQTGHSLFCTGRVKAITDGRFVITGPMQTGLEVNIGKSVFLDIGAAIILISQERWEPYDPACFTHGGVNPLESRYLLIKSRQHFRAGFESLASHIVLAAGPGVCSSDYSQFDFQSVVRPIYPLDEGMNR